jgi:predicted nucleic acid-binding protein
MIVVVNATPLIYLAAIGQFDLLRLRYGQIFVPAAVFDEVAIQGAGQWGAAETAAAGWIARREVTDRSAVSMLLGQLDLGESEVIVLAQEVGADLAVVDETAARRELASRGIPLIGTVGVLTQAKRQGLIVGLKAELDRLRACGFHLTGRVYRSCLAAVGE